MADANLPPFWVDIVPANDFALPNREGEVCGVTAGWNLETNRLQQRTDFCAALACLWRGIHVSIWSGRHGPDRIGALAGRQEKMN